jgi:hypothetical protein
MTPDTTLIPDRVIDLSQPQENLYKCECPNCISGAHYNKEIADSYRRRGQLGIQLTAANQRAEEALDIAKELDKSCKEVQQWHTDKESPEYNECEGDNACQWCSVVADIQVKLQRLKKLEEGR